MSVNKARDAVIMTRLARRYWILGLIFRKSGREYSLRWVLLLLVHAAFPALALVAGWADDTTTLRAAGGRGVYEHYGFHALFVSAPFLVFLVWKIAAGMARVVAQPLPWFGPARSKEQLELQRSLESVALCRPVKARGFLVLMRFVGLAAVIANAASTRIPEAIYGQDVFDSSRHALGYLAGRVFLAYYWIYLLPMVAYLAVAAGVVAFRIAAFVDELPAYEVRCFASDGCGGFKELGRLMTMVVYLWVPVVVVIIALKETHVNFYATLKLSAVLVVAIPAQLLLPFVRLHRVLTRLKERKLAALERFLTRSEQEIDVKRTKKPAHDDSHQGSPVPYVRLLAGESILRHTASVSTWPYLKTDVLRWLTPFIPVAMSYTLKQLGLA
jgi:hypothetical protein